MFQNTIISMLYEGILLTQYNTMHNINVVQYNTIISWGCRRRTF